VRDIRGENGRWLKRVSNDAFDKYQSISNISNISRSRGRKGAKEQESKGAREQGSKRAREQRGRGVGAQTPLQHQGSFTNRWKKASSQ
jgi:hypothetical protein